MKMFYDGFCTLTAVKEKEGHRPHIVIEPSKYGSTEVTIILAGQLFCGIELAQGSCGFVSCRRQLRYARVVSDNQGAHHFKSTFYIKSFSDFAVMELHHICEGTYSVDV
jgi:hypothetical protein